MIKNNFNRYVTVLMASLIAGMGVACSPVKILNAMVPENGYSLIAAVPYGELKRQKLDIYVPKVAQANNNKKVNRPKKVIIFYYGGNWDAGERGDYKFVAEALTSQGYIVVIPDYRLYPDLLFPAFMADPVSAAKWVKTHINQYGGDSNQVFLSGHSAGAHIAVMMAINPQYLAVASLKPNDFVGIIGLAGPYDFLPLKVERLKTIFGAEAEQWKSQPIHFVDGKNPPLLLAYGKKDDIVWPRNSINLAKKVKENNGLVDLVAFESYSHVDMVAKLAKPLRSDSKLLKTMTNFIDKH
jgi:acetyl esterase/lipase